MLLHPTTWHHKAGRVFRPIAGLLVLCLTIGLGSCTDDSTIYHRLEGFPQAIWHLPDTICIDAYLPDSAITAEVSVEVRTSTVYPYRNLPMTLLIESTDSVSPPAVNVEAEIADAYATWTGQGHGNLYYHSVPACRLTIAHPGTYRFKIIHNLPDSLLPGVQNIGVLITK